MSELYMMVTITDRDRVKKFTNLYKDSGVDVSTITVGKGTAASEILGGMFIRITSFVNYFTTLLA